MKRIIWVVAALFLLQLHVYAQPTGSYDTDAQLDALGKNELMDQVPGEARELMEDTGLYELSVENILQLSPGEFFSSLWKVFMGQIKLPLQTLAALTGVMLLCALLGGVSTAGAWEGNMSQLFGTVSVLCVLGAVVTPILTCIVEVTNAIREASLFMVTFIPVFSASLLAAGQPVTGATYNMFLFAACQVVSQVVSATLIPLMCIYLAICIAGSLAPGINISAAAGAIKSIVTWALGFILTIFVGLLSIQTMVSQGSDSVATKTTKFILGSAIPVVGGAISDAYLAAQGCLRLVKTSVGAYGIVVALLTFVPILLHTFSWYAVTNLGAVIGGLAGVPRVPEILKACSTVLGILIAVLVCYALLIIVSTTVVLVTGTAAG